MKFNSVYTFWLQILFCLFYLPQFEQLKQQQLMKQHGTPVWGPQKHQLCNNQQMLQNRERIAKPAFPLTAWPTLEQSQRQQLQPQPGSGMRAVFLGNPVSKRECAGTGVFLPRRFGAPTETRKKPGNFSLIIQILIAVDN